jgi:DNA-binding NarL/FixJ family response regulator
VIRVLVVSATPTLRAGLRALLAGDQDLAVSTAASLGDLAPEPGAPAGSGSPWDVVVATHGGLDLAGPGLRPEQALLLVTDDALEIRALSGLELRAWGVVSLETTAEALQAAVRALAEGLAAVSPALLQQALAAGNGSSADAAGMAGDGEDAPLAPLTEREVDVLLRLAQGLTNKQIALALGISEHTVKFHVSSIYSKLGVSNRAEAVRKGARKGWVPL